MGGAVALRTPVASATQRLGHCYRRAAIAPPPIIRGGAPCAWPAPLLCLRCRAGRALPSPPTGANRARGWHGICYWQAGTLYATPTAGKADGTLPAPSGVDMVLLWWHVPCYMKILDVPQSGSLAGQTSSRNRFGQYRRSRAIPVNPNTSAQQAARDDFSAASQAWRGLTQAQRDAWAAFATTRPRTNSLGQTIYLTGHQTFVGLRALLAAVGLTLPLVPPAGAAPELTVLAVTDSTAVAFEATATPNIVPANTAVQIQTSPPLSPGREFNGDFRTIRIAPATNAAEIVASDLTLRWGTLAAGQKFFLRMRPVSIAGGDGAWVTATAILT